VLLKDFDDLTNIEAIALFIKYCGDDSKKELIEKLTRRWEILKMANATYEHIIKLYGGKLMSFFEDMRNRDEEHNKGVVNDMIDKAVDKATADAKAEILTEIVRNSLLLGHSIAMIAKITNMTQEAILKI
jgi:hypothetical protein